MIDTSKYEGHAEGEWVFEMNGYGDECFIYAQDYGTIGHTFYREHDKLFLATTRLIADAPLLLAEVKRLREEIKDYDACLQNLWDKELIPEDTDIWDEVKELLEVD